MSHVRIRRVAFALALGAVPPLGFSAVAAGSAPTTTAGIRCSSETGGSSSGTVLYAGCTGNTGGSSEPVQWLPQQGGKVTITWVNNLQTTVHFKPFVVKATPGSCPSGSSEVQGSGSVKADTTGSAPVGQKVHELFCYDNSTGNITLVTGTKASI